ncbi:hypothetical protein [Pseudomonas sp. zfem002]|uniref:hypothetical protein n=1 Tax=Pseudomonas sp. zfem002 TaxID=3078197 RepID=UPI002929AA43|nr:hypothetical protein [Pseudomonas sp. zfem002]MDU9390444.1 hypothetical protein [Pseudomonas sp. zfem002]
MKSDSSFQGFIAPTSRDERTATLSPIYCDYFYTAFNLFDVPPWGIILPVDVAHSGAVKFALEIQTMGLPSGTMLGMRWTPADGKNIHRATAQLNGDETSNALMAINDDWLLEAEDQDVLIEHEISLPDGTVTIGDPVKVHVAKRVVFGSVQFDSLQPGEVIDPDLFPDGVSFSYNPIGNIREYHTVGASWSVEGVNGPVHTKLYYLALQALGSPGEDYHWLVPPEGYSEDLYDPQYARIDVIQASEVKLVPRPNPHFWYGYGGIRFDLKKPDAL